MNLIPRAAQPMPITPAVYQILLSLADGKRHGYGIMQEIDQRTSGEIRLGPGTLYRSIKRMRKAGLISAAESQSALAADDDRRRFYLITDYGHRILGDEAKRLARLVAYARDKNVLEGLSQ